MSDHQDSSAGDEAPQEWGRDRRKAIEECDLDPLTLVGSHFLVIEEEKVIWKGLVVGQPSPTTYLVSIDFLMTGAHKAQVLVPLAQMELADDGGREWRFYDDTEACEQAWLEWIASETERAEA